VYNVILLICVAISVILSRLSDVLTSGPKGEMRARVTSVHHICFIELERAILTKRLITFYLCIRYVFCYTFMFYMHFIVILPLCTGDAVRELERAILTKRLITFYLCIRIKDR